MRASERERRAQHRCGVMLDVPTDDGSTERLDAAELTPERIREWVAEQPRPILEGIVYDAILAARIRRPRL